VHLADVDEHRPPAAVRIEARCIRPLVAPRMLSRMLRL
jgi:hypothetical protein